MLKNDRDIGDFKNRKLVETDEKVHTADILWLVTPQPYIVKSFKSMENMRRHMNNAMEKTKLQ